MTNVFHTIANVACTAAFPSGEGGPRQRWKGYLGAICNKILDGNIVVRLLRTYCYVSTICLLSYRTLVPAPPLRGPPLPEGEAAVVVTLGNR